MSGPCLFRKNTEKEFVVAQLLLKVYLALPVNKRFKSSQYFCIRLKGFLFIFREMEVFRVGLKRVLSLEETERIRSPKSIIDKVVRISIHSW